MSGYIKNLIKLNKKNNLLCVFAFVLLVKNIVRIYILIYILLFVLSNLRLASLIMMGVPIVELKPSEKVFHSLMVKTLILLETKTYSISFVIFAYLFIFLVGFSLRTLEVSIKLYNSLKWFILVDQKPGITFLRRELYINVSPSYITVWKTKFILK